MKELTVTILTATLIGLIGGALIAHYNLSNWWLLSLGLVWFICTFIIDAAFKKNNK